MVGRRTLFSREPSIVLSSRLSRVRRPCAERGWLAIPMLMRMLLKLDAFELVVGGEVFVRRKLMWLPL